MNTFVGVIQALQDYRSTDIYIQLSRTFIGEEEVKMISQLMKGNTKIEAMDLSDNNISHEGGKYLGEMLLENMKLSVLDLKFNNMGPRGVRFIADALERNTALKHISLVMNNIGQQGGEYILRMLDRNTTLGEIDLEGNGIDNRLLNRIKEKLAKNKGDWLSKELRIPPSSSTVYAMAFHQKKIGFEEANRLAHFIEQYPMLGEISLNNNEMTEREMKSIVQALEFQRYLKSINIQDNKEIQSGLKYLAEMLEQNKSVADLTYNFNDAGSAGAKCFGQMLEKNQALFELNFSSNNIGDAGTIHIAQGIETNSTLRKLDLSFNNIGDDGAQHLGRALEGNSSITHIRLLGNNIGDRGFKYIVQALQINTTLAVIDLGDNKIGDDGAKQLKDMVERTTRAAQVNLEANKVSLDLKYRINEIIRKNGQQIGNILAKKLSKLEEVTMNAEDATDVLDRSNPTVAQVVRRFQEARETQRATVNFIKKSLQNKDKEIGIEAMSVKIDQLLVIMLECLSEIKQIDPLREEAKEEIIKLLIMLKSKNFSLYVYCKTFFWTMANLLGAYRQPTNGLMLRDTGMMSSMSSMRSSGGLSMNMQSARLAAKYASEIVEGAPFNEGTIRALDRVVESVYLRYNRFEKKSEGINKILRHKFEVEEDFAINVAKIAIVMVNVKQQTILDNQTLGSTSSTWLREEINRIKNIVLPSIELKEGANNSAATLALEHVILFIAYLCLDYNQLIQTREGLDLLCEDIIRQGGLDRLLPEVPKSPMQTPRSPGASRTQTYTTDPIPTKKSTRGCTGAGCSMF